MDNISRKCTKCFKIKDISNFNKQKRGLYGRTSYCKECNSKRCAEWKNNNLDQYRKNSRDWMRNKRVTDRKGYTQTRRKYENKRHRTDPIYREVKYFRNVVRLAFRNGKHYTEIAKAEKHLGLPSKDLVNYLHSTFEYNYGLPRECINLKDVEIDHIIPLSTAQSVEDVRRLNHYTNLQLLFKEDNQAKGSKVMNRIADAN